MKNMGKFPCFGSTCCNLYDILEFVAQDEQGKILFDSSFIQGVSKKRGPFFENAIAPSFIGRNFSKFPVLVEN